MHSERRSIGSSRLVHLPALGGRRYPVLTIPLEYAPQSSFLPTLQSLEETMAETCQCAKRFVFSVFRQICSATSLLSRKTEDLDQSAIIECLRAMMDAIEKLSSTHDDWLDQCQSNFLQLSTQSKQFAGLSL